MKWLFLLLPCVVWAFSNSAFEPRGLALRLIPLSVDQKLGASASANIDQSTKPVRDPRVQEFIQTLGARLTSQVPHSQFQYRFRVIRDKGVNAFALPGGFVYVQTGLIETAQSMDELAGVMGHEIGHVALRHSTKMLSRMLGVDVLLASAGVILSAYLNADISSLWRLTHETSAYLLRTKFSRDHERDADRFGVYLTSHAGFDPQGLAQFFARLSEGRSAAFLSTHPSPEERIERIRAEIGKAQLKRPDTRSQRDLQSIKSLL